jgi:hypothetical protein
MPFFVFFRKDTTGFGDLQGFPPFFKDKSKQPYVNIHKQTDNPVGVN